MRVFLTIILLIFPKLVFGGIGDIYECDLKDGFVLTGKNITELKSIKVPNKNTKTLKFIWLENSIKLINMDYTIPIKFQKFEQFIVNNSDDINKVETSLNFENGHLVKTFIAKDDKGIIYSLSRLECKKVEY